MSERFEPIRTNCQCCTLEVNRRPGGEKSTWRFNGETHIGQSPLAQRVGLTTHALRWRIKYLLCLQASGDELRRGVAEIGALSREFHRRMCRAMKDVA